MSSSAVKRFLNTSAETTVNQILNKLPAKRRGERERERFCIATIVLIIINLNKRVECGR